MAVNFVSASSQYIKNAAPTFLPSSGFPMTMAGWVNFFTASTTYGLFGFWDTATSNNFLRVFSDNLNHLQIGSNSGGTTANATTTGTYNTAVWNFIVARFISATNRRLSVLFSGGAVEHIQEVTSKIPTSLDTIGVGAQVHSAPSNFMNGLIGEFWYTNTDIQPDGAALSDSLLLQLAYGGPFSVPAIIKDILEYRSLRSDILRDVVGETYSRGSPMAWTQSGSPALGPHPLLPYSYVRPAQTERILVI